MGLFGNLLSKFNGVNPETGLSFADRLSAAGGALGGDTSSGIHLQQLGQGRIENNRLGSVRKQLEEALRQAYTPQQQAPRQMGPTVDEGMPQSPGPPQVDQAEMIRQALLQANAQGLDTGGAGQLVPQDAYQIINGGNGAYGIANKRSGQVQAGQLPNPMLDDNQAKLQAQIEQYKALAEKARQDAALAAAKAKGGGFAPRAPARGRSTARTLPPLPSGRAPEIIP